MLILLEGNSRSKKLGSLILSPEVPSWKQIQSLFSQFSQHPPQKTTCLHATVEQVVESVVEWIQMRQVQVSVRFFIGFYWSLTCCLAGGVSEDARAAASTVEGKGTGGKYQVSQIGGRTKKTLPGASHNEW